MAKLSETIDRLDLELENHAYFYGLCLADGSLIDMERGRGRLAVELEEGDADTLLRLQKALPWKSSLLTRARATNFSSWHTSVKLSFSAKALRDQFKAAGFPVGKKSRICAPPSIPYNEAAFWRGFVDGDGSVGITEKGIPFVSMMTASDKLSSAFCSFVDKVCGYRPRVKPNKRDGVRNFMVTRIKAIILAHRLYDDAEIAIWRKKDNARILMGC